MRKINPLYMETICAEVNRSPYFELLSMRLIRFDIGNSVVEIEVQGKHLQPFGMVHGGVFSSLMDAAAFWAVYPEVEETAGMTTVDLKLNYLAPAAAGKLIARGRRIKIGKNLGLGEVDVSDQDGKILAHGISTVMIVRDLAFMNQKALPPKFVEE